MSTLTIWRPPMLRRRFRPAFSNLLEDWTPSHSDIMNWNPKVDIIRENGHFKLTAEFPGIEKDDIQVDVREGTLTLRGEKKSEVNNEKEGNTYMERSYGSFERSFQLPSVADVEAIHAELNNGVLTLTIPIVQFGMDGLHISLRRQLK